MQISAANSPVVAAKRDWTILYVLDGDNELREAATLDMVELHKEGAPENTAVIAQLYRGDLKWSFANFAKKVASLFKPSTPAAVAQDWRGMKVYEVGHLGTGAAEASYSPSTTPSPSDRQSLEDYLAWGMQQYPAEHYAVVLSGHGSPNGLLSDSASKQMPFEQVSQALKGAATRSGHSVDVVLFDSCSTAGPVAEAAMKGATDYLVASENRIKAGGWSEKLTMEFLKTHPQATPAELAQSFMSKEHTAVTAPVLYDYTGA